MFGGSWVSECLYLNVSGACLCCLHCRYFYILLLLLLLCVCVCGSLVALKVTFWCFLICKMWCVSLENITSWHFLFPDFNSLSFYCLLILAIYLPVRLSLSLPISQPKLSPFSLAVNLIKFLFSRSHSSWSLSDFICVSLSPSCALWVCSSLLFSSFSPVNEPRFHTQTHPPTQNTERDT